MDSTTAVPDWLFADCYEEAERLLQAFSLKFVLSVTIRKAYKAGAMSQIKETPQSLSQEMNDEGLTAPPDELVPRWAKESEDEHQPDIPLHLMKLFAAKASRWAWEQRGVVNETELQKARDEELDACCALIGSAYVRDRVRAARRPKPPSLKERALEVLGRVSKDGYPCNHQDDEDWNTILQALELLPDDAQ